jgi:hypothetical protein
VNSRKAVPHAAIIRKRVALAGRSIPTDALAVAFRCDQEPLQIALGALHPVGRR